MPNPEISIGIPTLNGPERLDRCLRAIRKYTPLEKYNAEVVVSDDFSLARHLTENKVICHAYGIPMLMAETRVGVSEQWNRLVRHTNAPVQVLMNDDVEVVPHWLEALAYSVRENPHAGMVGLKAYTGVTTINFTPPPLVSYAEAVMERGSGLISSCGYLFGFMRDKWEAVGGFDTRYRAFYEELQFGYDLWKNHWPSYMLSYPIVLHQGGATTSDSSNINAQKVMVESRESFRRKNPSISDIRRDMDALDAQNPWPRLKHWNTGLLVLSDP